jgi:hypothetical protein
MKKSFKYILGFFGQVYILLLIMELWLIKTIIILSPTKLRRDIVTLPSVRHILVNTLGSTSFNGF